MTDAELAARQHRSHLAFNERFATRVARPGGSVLAGVTPAAPDRSLPNAVLYDDPGDVVALLDDLGRLYADAGIRAWTVWVRPEDPFLADVLAEAGHVHDGRPMRMGATLEDLDLTTPAPAHVVGVEDWGAIGALNDAAYGVTGLAEAFATYRGGDTRGWMAIVDGAAAATVSVLEHEGDAYVAFVATHPDARGRGLCRGLMAHALREAAAAGCTTTTLEGSPMGEPIYTRLGYRSLGRFGLWERRVRNDSA